MTHQVTIQDVLTVTCERFSPHSWNGWAVPLFTTDQGLALLAANDAYNLANPDQAEYFAWFTYNPQADEFTEHSAQYPESPYTLPKTAEGLHALGNGWTWEDDAPKN
jgi:hypothetical protein